MPPSSRHNKSSRLSSLDAETVARISSLEVQTRTMAEGLIAGRHKSPFRGGSATFTQHRAYSPGDDLRYLDWKVWAKSDRLYVKEFEEETNLRATIIVDGSGSMGYGEGDRNKFAYARLLAGALAYLLLKQSDSVGLDLVAGDETVYVPHRNQTGQLQDILAPLAHHRPRSTSSFWECTRPVAERETKRGIVVVISDLLGDAGLRRDALQQLCQHRHDVIVLQVLHEDEINFPFRGSTRFEGLEDPGHILCDPVGLRRDYQRAIQAFLHDVVRQSGSLGIDYRLARTEHSPDRVLAALLHERMRR